MIKEQKHLMLLGGHGPRAAAHATVMAIETFNGLGARADHEYPLITTLSWPLARLDSRGRGSLMHLQEEAERLLRQAQQLSPDLVVPTCVTTSPLLSQAAEMTPLRVLSPLDETASTARQMLGQGAAVTALQSRESSDQDLWTETLHQAGMKPSRSHHELQRAVDQIVTAAMEGATTQEGARMLEAALRLAKQKRPGDLYILGCSELSIFATQMQTSLPILDAMGATLRTAGRLLEQGDPAGRGSRRPAQKQAQSGKGAAA